MYHNNLYYTKEGDGDVVLFLHGWGADGSIWKSQVKTISQRCCAITVDFCGFGNSVEPPSGSNATFYAYKIADLLQYLEVQKVSIIAHSFGGRVAIILSKLLPRKVDKLVLVNSAGLRRFSVKKSLKIFAYKMTKTLVKMRLIRAKVLERFGSSDYKALKPSMRETFVAVTQQELSALLPQIKCPTLLIWGKGDSQTPLWIAKKMLRKIPNCALIFIGNGHFGAYENPAQFNAVLQTFLL